MRFILLVLFFLGVLLPAQTPALPFSLEEILQADAVELRSQFLSQPDSLTAESMYQLIAKENINLWQNDSLSVLQTSSSLKFSEQEVRAAPLELVKGLMKMYSETKSSDLNFNVFLKEAKEKDFVLDDLDLNSKEAALKLYNSRIDKIIQANLFYGKGTKKDPYWVFDPIFFRNYVQNYLGKTVVEHQAINKDLDLIVYEESNGERIEIYFIVIGVSKTYMFPPKNHNEIEVDP